MRIAEAKLASVVDGASDELGDVIVRQGVNDVLVVPSSGDQACGPQHFQALGDRGQALAGQGRQVRYATFTVVELQKQTETTRVARRSKELGCLLQEPGVEPRRARRGRVVTGKSRFLGQTIHQSLK